MSEPLRAGIYIRVSDGDQEDNYSFEVTQEQTCRDFITAQGWTLDPRHIYRDVLTGSTMKRPDLDRARAAIARRELDKMVVYRLDRFGRDADDRVFLRVEAKQSGVQWVSATEKNDDTPEGRLVDYISAYAAGWERRALIKRTQDGIRARVNSGKRLVGAKPPYGYRWTQDYDEKGKWIKSGLVIFEPEAVVVRRIMRAIANGQSFRSLAADLNKDGIPTPNPARAKTDQAPKWQTRTIHLLMSNPVYTGRSVAYRQQAPSTNGKPEPRIKPETEWVDVPGNTVPAIIDQATWDQAQARRAVNRERSSRSKTDHKDALLRGGFARCAYCDAALQVHRFGNGRIAYRCGHLRPKPGCREDGRAFGTRIEAKNLDREVWAAVEEILSNPSVVMAKLRADLGDDTATKELAEITRALHRLDQQEMNLTDAIAQAASPAAIAALTRKLDALAEQRSSLRRQQADAQLRDWGRRAAIQQANDLAAWCERERADLARLDYDGKRDRLERLGIRAHISHPGTFEGRWTLTIQPRDITLHDLRAGQAMGDTELRAAHDRAMARSLARRARDRRLPNPSPDPVPIAVPAAARRKNP